MSARWRVLERIASPDELVGALPESGGERLACICRPTSAAVVLGSAQSFEAMDAAWLAGAGIGVTRRNSGGGAVFVAPGAQVWLDVFVPAGDPLLVADVGRSAWWLGDAWAGALSALGAAPPTPARLEVHRGGLVGERWSRLACFSGLGPGEVTAGGQKLVGISQRRTRAGAWLHSMALLELDAVSFARSFLLSADERHDLASELARTVAVAPVPEGRLAAELDERFTSGNLTNR
jgi:lipoate-protein ligase A